MIFLTKGSPWSVVVIPSDQGSTNQNRPVPETMVFSDFPEFQGKTQDVRHFECDIIVCEFKKIWLNNRGLIKIPQPNRVHNL